MHFHKYALLCALAPLSLTALAQSSEQYPINFDKTQTITYNGRRLHGVSLTSADGAQTIIVGTRLVYNDLTDETFTALPGDEMKLSVNYQSGANPWMHSYVYLDKNRDGQFSEDELLSFSYAKGKNSLGQDVDKAPGAGNALQPPTFILPKDMAEGSYRLRVKVDWDNTDPAGALGEDGTALGNNGIVANGGAIADFTLSLHATAYPPMALHIDTRHANIYAQRGALPLQPQRNQPLTVRIVPVEKSYEAQTLVVRYGLNPNGDEVVDGMTQWKELPLTPNAQGQVTLPAEVMNGQVRLIAHYRPTEKSKLLPVFNDEFDGSPNVASKVFNKTEDNNAATLTNSHPQPNPTWWKRTERQGATWNRFCSNDTAVVFLRNGELICRAMATPDRLKGQEPKDFISGGVKTQGKFDFRYGRAEARIWTKAHTGSFPAFWMMPSDNSKGWPNNGEIDIWEMVNTQATSFHTLHSHWTYDLGHKSDPTSAVQGRNIDYDRYHTFAVEWDATHITWYVDGERVGSAPKSTSADALANGQWPYTAPFYLILNQSVGNGGWAHNPDPAFVYETRFDWVRVYQTEEQNPLLTGIERTPFSPLSPAKGDNDFSQDGHAWFDLTGRRVLSPSSTHGVVVNGKGKKVINTAH